MKSPEADAARLRHMLDYTQKAVQFTNKQTRDDLDKNELLSLAVVHLIVLIGEAAYGVSEGTQEKHPEIPWKLITGTRNRLAHGYNDVDMDIIWTIVKKDLPLLIKKIKIILQ